MWSLGASNGHSGARGTQPLRHPDTPRRTIQSFQVPWDKICLQDFCLKNTSSRTLFHSMYTISNFFHTGKVAQSCPALCDPVDDTAHGILQARYWSE